MIKSFNGQVEPEVVKNDAAESIKTLDYDHILNTSRPG
jgi:hypothetical protein